MKVFKPIIVLICIVFSLFSCSVSKTNTAKTKDINSSGITHLPILANLNIRSTKVTGTATGLLKAPMVTKNSIKQEALAVALAKVNGDVLIEPFYRTESVGKQFTVTITGYPATYKDFRMMEEKDTTLFYMAYPEAKNRTVSNTIIINKSVKNDVVSKGKPAPFQSEKQYAKYGKPGDRTPIQQKKANRMLGLTWGIGGAIIIGLLSFVAING